jgi:elongation factor Ts
VKELRDRTGAGMMDCKTALEASSGDLEKAIDFLRKKGMAQAAKRAGREAKEGVVVAGIRGKKAALCEANCETDFVARTDDFKNLAAMALEKALEEGETAVGSGQILARIAELSGKIGEKIVVRRAKVIQSSGGRFFSYIHSNQKLGVLVEVSSGQSSEKPEFQELGKNLAMQVAASNPICVTRAGMPAAVLEREKAIYREEIKGKPENIVEKILQGKVDKFYQASCLLEQPFIRDDKLSVKDLVDGLAKSLKDSVEVKQFVRFQLGETVAS